MVVSRDYMLKQPSGPSAPKLFLDTKVVPAAVNVLGDVEVMLSRASLRTGVSGSVILAGITAFASAGVCGLLLRRSLAVEQELLPVNAASPLLPRAHQGGTALPTER